jgi:hypothetical protein
MSASSTADVPQAGLVEDSNQGVKENKALRSWVDADARNHAKPADYDAPVWNAQRRLTRTADH